MITLTNHILPYISIMKERSYHLAESFLPSCVPRKEEWWGRGVNRGKEERRGQEGRKRKKKEGEEEDKENCHACKNAETYHICNLILLPSSSIVLLLKAIPGKMKGGREGGEGKGKWAGRKEGGRKKEGRRKEEGRGKEVQAIP